MPKSIREILADELFKRIENYEPRPEQGRIFAPQEGRLSVLGVDSRQPVGTAD